MTQEATATLMMRAALGRRRNSTMKTAAAKLMMRLQQQPKLLQKRPRLLKLKRRRRRRSGASARRAMAPPAAAATKNLKALQPLVMTRRMVNRHRSRRRLSEKAARPADLLAAFETRVLLCCRSLSTWHICAFVMNSFGSVSRAQLHALPRYSSYAHCPAADERLLRLKPTQVSAAARLLPRPNI
jgi:hypothetical protein